MTRRARALSLIGSASVVAIMVVSGCSFGAADRAAGSAAGGASTTVNVSSAPASSSTSPGMTSFSSQSQLLAGASSGAAASGGDGDGSRAASGTAAGSMSVLGTSESAGSSSPSTSRPGTADDTELTGRKGAADVTSNATGTATTPPQRARRTTKPPAPKPTVKSPARKPKPPAAKPKLPSVITGSVLADINAHRTAAGVPALKASTCANSSALAHSKAEAKQHRMFHRSLAAIKAACGMPGGENVAFGYASPSALMKGWWGSAPHRANLLDQRYVYTGIAMAYASDGTPYYTQVFYIPN